jgi:1-acyl-sn-glycerol-3-phosphate acyltransferase
VSIAMTTSPVTLLLVSLLLLLLPWLVRSRPQPAPEITPPLRALWWLNRFLCGLLHRLDLPDGLAPLPARGPAILIANHTCGIDNFLLQAGCDRVLGFLIVQQWYDNPVCGVFCRLIGAIPVKRDGRDLGATRAALRALKAGRVVPLFPEGKIQPYSGEQFGEARPGAAYLALHADVPVIPAYIRGTPATPSVVEALYRPSHARVVFGPPVDLSDVPRDGSGTRDKELIASVTERLMAAIRALKEGGADRLPSAGPLPRPLPEPAVAAVH